MSTTLLDEMRRTMRRRHYSIRTERSYCSWVKRYILFHKMRSRDVLNEGEPKIEAFLTHTVMDLGHKDISITMVYAHILQQGGQGVASPLDDLS